MRRLRQCVLHILLILSDYRKSNEDRAGAGDRETDMAVIKHRVADDHVQMRGIVLPHRPGAACDQGRKVGINIVGPL